VVLGYQWRIFSDLIGACGRSGRVLGVTMTLLVGLFAYIVALTALKSPVANAAVGALYERPGRS